MGVLGVFPWGLSGRHARTHIKVCLGVKAVINWRYNIGEGPKMSSQEIAQTIFDQIEAGVRWSIGFRPGTQLHGMFQFSDGCQDEGLMFTAKPRHRLRRIAITLNFMDTYDIRVIDDKGIRILIENVYVDQLNRTLLDLESNPKA